MTGVCQQFFKFWLKPVDLFYKVSGLKPTPIEYLLVIFV